MKQYFLYLFLLPLLLGSCSNDEQEDVSTGDVIPVRLSAGIAGVTRTTNGGDKWATTDEVGLFMLTHNGNITTSGDVLEINRKYNPTSADASSMFALADGGSTIYYPQDGSRVDFRAYYPHGIITAGKYSISVNNQTTEDQQNGIDVLYAQQDDIVKTTSVVSLQFKHVMSKITLNVKAGTDIMPGDVSGLLSSDVVFHGMPISTKLDLQNGNLTDKTTGDFSPLKMPAPTTYDATFTAIIVPQESGTSRTITFEVGSQTYTANISDADIFVAGKHYSYTITIEKTKIILSSPDIIKWNEKDNGEGKIIETVLIPAGTFLMGSPATEPDRDSNETQHQVTLSKSFYMSKYQITNAQYASFLNANGIGNDGQWASGSYPSKRLIYASGGSSDWGLHYNTSKWDPVSGYENHPVINVTWYGAMEYARWVGGSLPTEAQWEYACRGDYLNKATETRTLPFGIGEGKKLVSGMANYYLQYSYDLGHNPSGAYYVGNNTGYLDETSPVGNYSPNNYGLYDMHGNVWEWCSDWFGNYGSVPVTDPTGPTTSSVRVLRGGSWFSFAEYCRSAYRYGGYPDNARINIGFRVVFVP